MPSAYNPQVSPCQRRLGGLSADALPEKVLPVNLFRKPPHPRRYLPASAHRARAFWTSKDFPTKNAYQDKYGGDRGFGSVPNGGSAPVGWGNGAGPRGLQPLIAPVVMPFVSLFCRKI